MARFNLTHLKDKIKSYPKYDTLNKEQIYWCNQVLDGNHTFLTGIAGSGKSYVIQFLFDFLTANYIYVGKTAMTGVAALLISAQTAHSFLGIGLGDENTESLIKKVKKNKKARRRIENCQVLIIDEISMMNAELFDKVIEILKYFRGNEIPVLIITGEFLQLPPVQKFYTEAKLFAFEADYWNKLNIKCIELTELVRQDSDTPFAKLLRNIRVGNTEGIELLHSRVGAKLNTKFQPIKIFCKNLDVDKLNQRKYDLLDGEEQVYWATDTGDEKYKDFFNRNCPAPKELRLKIGAQVMLLRNVDVSAKMVNGSIGKIVKFSNTGPIMEFETGAREIIVPEEWSIKSQEKGLDGKMVYKKIAVRKQIPLRLAYASTIHKVMGSTLDFAEIDLSKSWEYGAHYVALSRVKTLEGLSLTEFSPEDVKAHPKCIEFYKNIKNNN